jgi:membrane protease YdiL (CAAX protease family)
VTTPPTSPPPPPPPPPPRPWGGPPRHVPAGDPAWPGGGVRDGAAASEAFRVPFSGLEGFLLVLWTLAAQFVVILPAVLLGVLDPNEASGPMLLALVITAQAVGLAGALGYLAARRRLSWRLLGPRRPALSHVWLGLGFGVGGFIAVNLLIAGLLEVFGPVDPPEQQLLSDVTEGGVTTALAVIAAVLMAPLVEEVVFRGVLYQGLKRRMGLWPAAVVSALLFAVVHVEVQQPVYSSGFVLLGLLFAWTMHRFGSLVVPIVAHASFNAVSVGLTLLGTRVLDTT